MRQNVSARLEAFADAARKSPFIIGKLTKQPVEVRTLQNAVRAATSARRVQLWTTKGAAAIAGGPTLHIDHVVPVVVLTERILMGASVEEVFEQAVLCQLLPSEHRPSGGEPGLRVAFRLDHSDLYKQMLDCPIGELATLGWKRYESVGLWPVDRLS